MYITWAELIFVKWLFGNVVYTKPDFYKLEKLFNGIKLCLAPLNNPWI
jgi:hypothetical protein